MTGFCAENDAVLPGRGAIRPTKGSRHVTEYLVQAGRAEPVCQAGCAMKFFDCFKMMTIRSEFHHGPRNLVRPGSFYPYRFARGGHSDQDEPS